MALGHPRRDGATVFGVPATQRVQPGMGGLGERHGGARTRHARHLPRRRLLASRRQHSADPGGGADDWRNQGRDLIRGIATGYEIHIDLVRAICLHEHKIDHIAHLCPAQAAGIGTLLGLKQEVIYQAVQQAVHVSFTTRQSRKGEISSWKAYAPAHAGKLAVEAVDRVMRGEGAPSPIYEGEDCVIAWMLDGADAHYHVPLPGARRGETRHPGQLHQGAQRRISESGADRSRLSHARKDRRSRKVEKIVLHTSHHTHYVIGTGANDPQKMDPKAQPRDARSLDHVHLRRRPSGRALAPCGSATRRSVRARRDTVELWHKIETREDPEWTRRYHSRDPNELAFGGRVEVLMQDGRAWSTRLAVANAHPLGAKPFARADYLSKFRTLTDGIITAREANRFLEPRREPAKTRGGRAQSH